MCIRAEFNRSREWLEEIRDACENLEIDTELPVRASLVWLRNSELPFVEVLVIAAFVASAVLVELRQYCGETWSAPGEGEPSEAERAARSILAEIDAECERLKLRVRRGRYQMAATK